MLLSAMVTKVRVEAGIDATDAQIEGWLHDRIERLIVRAKWRRADIEFATSEADVATYVNPANVVDVMDVEVDGEPYDLASIEELRSVKRGDGRLRGRGGVFAPHYSEDGSSDGIELYPAPASAGLAVTALVALKPPQTALNAEPPFPSDLHHGAWEGAIADGLGLMDERLAEAAAYEAKFETVAVELDRRRKGLIGSGPVQIGVPTY